jgi:tetratricopeptide (TPR) repeat protein
MLFDLQGKRRRLVQATYLVLAVLMGGGLVLFGIGGGTDGGGLFDAITGRNGNGGSINSTVEKRIKADEKAVALNPKNTTALASLIRSHYQLATDDSDANTGQFGPKGKAELEKAASAWERYLAANPKKPDDALAGLMLNAYGDLGLNRPDAAARAAELVAEARPSAVAYLQLTQYAAKAGQTRKADLAGKKAIELAPKAQKKQVEQQVAALKAAAGTSTQTTG